MSSGDESTNNAALPRVHGGPMRMIPPFRNGETSWAPIGGSLHFRFLRKNWVSASKGILSARS
jgi:hypothetical protein